MSRIYADPEVGCAAALAIAAARDVEIVFLCGGFDPLHAEHVRLIEWAGGLSPESVVVVAVNGDRVAARKGLGRPFAKAPDRAAVVAALRRVDVAFVFEADEPSGLIRALRPAVVAKGPDYRAVAIPDAAAAAEVGARVEFAPWMKTISSSVMYGEKMR